LFDFETTCAEASFPAIVDEPNVVAACYTFIDRVVGLLFARAAAAKAGIFKLRAANREIDRTALAAHVAQFAVNMAVKKAMIAHCGFDGSHEGFAKALASIFDDEHEGPGIAPEDSWLNSAKFPEHHR
jgi:hypothetical protein